MIKNNTENVIEKGTIVSVNGHQVVVEDIKKQNENNYILTIFDETKGEFEYVSTAEEYNDINNRAKILVNKIQQDEYRIGM